MTRGGAGVAGIGTAVLLLLPGCAGPSTASGAEVALVEIVDGGFQPATLAIPVGTEVRWVNRDPVVHGITADDEPVAGEPALPEGAQPWDSGPLYEGETFSRRFDVEGSYVYRSAEIGSAQMVGTLRVEGS